MRSSWKRLVAVFLVAAMFFTMAPSSVALAGPRNGRGGRGGHNSWWWSYTEETEAPETEAVVETEEVETVIETVVEEETEAVVTETEAEASETEVAETEVVSVPEVITVSGKTAKVYVDVEYDEGVLPEGTEMVVKDVDADTYMDQVNEVVEGNVSEMAAVDITFSYEGQEIQPDGDIKVSLALRSDLGEADNYSVVHIKEDAETDETVVEVVEDDAIVTEADETGAVFMAGSFSVYAVVAAEAPAVLADTVQVRALNAAIKAASTHITATKNMDDPDGDGVFEMALSVTGSAQSSTTTEVDKSNVIIVMDRSNSMSNNTYVEYVYDADTYDSNTSYYRRGNYGNYERVYYRNGAWRTSNNNYGTIHNGPVYIRTTRINAEQAALDSVVQNLLANNRDEDNLRDIIEISIIGYALQSPFKDDNGNVVAATQISNSNDYDAIMAAVNNDSQRSGTNWDDALREALREANALKAAEKDEAVYIIFLTDGEPTASHGDTNYSTGTANYWKHWGNANTQATAIVDAGYEFFSIFTYGDNNTYINYLNNLTRSAHGVGTYTQSNFGNTNTYHDNFFNATDTSELVEAFEAIVDKINSNVGYAGVSYEDGVTVGVTNTSVTVDGSINTDSFHYTVLNGSTEVYKVSFKTSGSTRTATFTINGTEYTTNEAKTFTADLDNNGTIANTERFTYYSVTVGGKEYKMAPASMNADGLVDWELAGLGILENGYTYKLTFDVWPNQLSYDLVADLNNGVKTISEIEADVVADKGQDTWDQIEKAIQVTYTEDDVEVTDSLVNLTDDVKTAIEKGEIKASYAILTNYTQTVNYYTADEETNETTGVTTTTYTAQEPYNPPQPNPISLTSTQMLLEKIWDDSLDEDQLKEILWNDYYNEEPSDPTEYKVPLIIWKSDSADVIDDVQATTDAIAAEQGLGTTSSLDELKTAFEGTEGYYMTKILGWNEELTGYSWQDTLDVAPGTLITLERAEEMGITIADDNIVSYNGTDYYILESGHYYTVSEVATDRHFELNTIIYHPMLVNRKVQNVTFTTERDENGHIIIESIVPMSSVDANNTLKGGINVRKQILDLDGSEVTHSDDQFTVTITMKDTDGTPYTDFDYRVYYGESNPNYADTETYPKARTGHIFGTTAAVPADNTKELTTETEPGEDYYTVLDNTDGVITATLYVGDTLRVINVPAGVTYQVAETQVNGDTIANSDYAYVKIDYEIARGSSEEENYEADTADDNGYYTVAGNAASRATVVNNVPVAQVEVLKRDADTEEGLEGIEFKLYADEELTYQIVKDAYGNDIGTEGTLTSDADGKISVGGLTAGTYYLKETKTNVGYTLPEDPIMFVITKADAEGQTFTVTVDNDPQYFYVYHSSDRTIERIKLDGSDARVTIEEDGTFTFNIVNETKADHLYGGYFSAFKGAGMTDAQIIASDYTAADSADYTYTTKTAALNNWLTDSAGTAYDGSLSGQWTKKTAYTTDSGLAMKPVADGVYYLKEVPDQYFRPALYYVYDRNSENLDLKKLYLMVPTDDNLYQLVCGKPIAISENTKLYGTFKAVNDTGETESFKVPDVNTQLTRGYLTVWDGAEFMVPGQTYTWTPDFVTLDGVEVTSCVTRTISTGDLCHGTAAGKFSSEDSPVDSTAAEHETE